jgi:putative sterol carrier protein
LKSQFFLQKWCIENNIVKKTMTLEAFKQKIEEITTRNPELNYKVKFVIPQGLVFIDGTSRPNRISEEDLAADTTIEITLEDAFKFLEGELNPTMAFMTGRLKVQGSLGVALKLVEIAKS